MKALMISTVLAWALISTSVHGQDGDDTSSPGRWLPLGTFALSDLDPIPAREKSYARSSEENERVLTFLPGMTIVYQIDDKPDRRGYVSGLTHSGIPVKVPQSELSSGIFDERSAKDVVVHFEHEGCRNITCSDDRFQVGAGQSFIMETETDQRIELYNKEDGIRAVYPTTKFENLESRGLLTRHKDRISPRWQVHDGYAKSLSTQCGEVIDKGNYRPKIAAAVYEAQLSKWAPDSENWSMKALEVLGLGKVTKNEDTGDYEGTLTVDIKYEADWENVAIDYTIFAYRDSAWEPSDYYKFAAVSQIVKCEKPNVGALRPTYAFSADLFFDKKSGDGYEQNFPLQSISLENIYSIEDKREIFSYHGRSFFYSVNSYLQYRRLFDRLSNDIPYPNAVAHIIARLNASCGQSDRNKCEQHTEID